MCVYTVCFLVIFLSYLQLCRRTRTLRKWLAWEEATRNNYLELFGSINSTLHRRTKLQATSLQHTCAVSRIESRIIKSTWRTFLHHKPHCLRFLLFFWLQPIFYNFFSLPSCLSLHLLVAETSYGLFPAKGAPFQRFVLSPPIG